MEQFKQILKRIILTFLKHDISILLTKGYYNKLIK